MNKKLKIWLTVGITAVLALAAVGFFALNGSPFAVNAEEPVLCEDCGEYVLEGECDGGCEQADDAPFEYTPCSSDCIH